VEDTGLLGWKSAKVDRVSLAGDNSLLSYGGYLTTSQPQTKLMI